MTRKYLVLGAMLVIAAAGCSPKVQVSSDRCWRATFSNNTAAEGCGNRSYSMPHGSKCVSIYLKSDTGFLQARIEKGDWVTTTTPYGTITVCK